MINDHKCMDGMTPEQQALKTIRHILIRVNEHPFVGYYLGFSSQSFALLTEAYATLTKGNLREVREYFAPSRPRDPVEEAKERVIAENSNMRTVFDDDEVATMKEAIGELESLAMEAVIAAATTTQHNGLAFLQQGERRDDLASRLLSIKLKYEK